MNEILKKINGRAEYIAKKTGDKECDSANELIAMGLQIAIEIIQAEQKEPTNHDNIIKIAEHYGLDRQLDKLQEESAELIQAIQKYIHCDSGLATVNLYSELADLSIVLEEVIHLLGCSEEVAKIREYKIERQLKRMAEGTE